MYALQKISYHIPNCLRNTGNTGLSKILPYPNCAQLKHGIHEWIRDKTGPEQKKSVLQSGFWPRLAQCFIHVIPMGATAAVLYLTISQTYWKDPSEPYTQTKPQGLQFAAKLYESFICASLASMILHVLRRDLLGDDGVALGTVISAFSFNQITTITSPTFWMGFGYRRKYRSSALLLALLAISILLGAAAGPSAAIAVIPKLGWWPAAAFDSISFFSDRPQYSVNSSVSDLWPSSLNGSHLPDSTCLKFYNLQTPTCPGSGYETLPDFALFWRNNGDLFGFARPSALEPLNLSFAEPAVAVKPFSRPVTLTLDCFLSDEKLLVRQYDTVASTSSLVVDTSLWNVLQHSGSLLELDWERATMQVDTIGLRPPMKPFVQVKCIDVIHETDFNSTGSIHFPNYGLLTPGFSRDQAESWRYLCESWDGAPNLYENQQFSIPAAGVGNAEDLRHHMQNKSSYFTWTDLSEHNESPSIAAAVYLPRCDFSSPALYTCSVDARWLPTATWIEPTADVSIHGTRGSYKDLLRSMAGDLVPLQPIRLGLDWAGALNTKLSLNNIINDGRKYLE